MLRQSNFSGVCVKNFLKNFTEILQDVVRENSKKRYIVYKQKTAIFQGKLAIAFLIGSDYNRFSTSILGYIFYVNMCTIRQYCEIFRAQQRNISGQVKA